MLMFRFGPTPWQVPVLAGVVIVFFFSSVVPWPSPSSVCNAWTTESSLTTIHQFASRRRSTAKLATGLWNMKDNNNNNNNDKAKGKNYSPYQASWKRTEEVEVAPKKTIMPDLPKFKAPKMPTMPDMQMPDMQMPDMQMPDMQMPSMPEFTIPKFPDMQMPDMQIPDMQMPDMQMPSMPEFTIPKFPEFQKRSQGNTDTKINTVKNYSRHQASWKKTTTPTTITATTTKKAADGNISFSNTKLELPNFALPDLSELGLSNNIHVMVYNDEVQKLSLQIDKNIKDKVNKFTGRSQYEVGDITKAIIAKVANEEFELGEVTFFFRILIAVGADLSGFSAVLPVSGLIGVFGWSISMGLAERFAKYVSIEINNRVLNNNNLDELRDASDTSSMSVIDVNASSVTQQYNPGDLTKSDLLEYTGKSSYAVGDLTGKGGSNNVDMNSSVLQELEECLSMGRELIEKLGRIQQQ